MFQGIYIHVMEEDNRSLGEYVAIEITDFECVCVCVSRYEVFWPVPEKKISVICPIFL